MVVTDDDVLDARNRVAPDDRKRRGRRRGQDVGIVVGGQHVLVRILAAEDEDILYRQRPPLEEQAVAVCHAAARFAAPCRYQDHAVGVGQRIAGLGAARRPVAMRHEGPRQDVFDNAHGQRGEDLRAHRVGLAIDDLRAQRIVEIDALDRELRRDRRAVDIDDIDENIAHAAAMRRRRRRRQPRQRGAQPARRERGETPAETAGHAVSRSRASRPSSSRRNILPDVERGNSCGSMKRIAFGRL